MPHTQNFRQAPAQIFRAAEAKTLASHGAVSDARSLGGRHTCVGEFLGFVANVSHAVHGHGRLGERSGGSQGSQSNNERLFTESSAKLQQRFRNISESLRV